MLNRLPAEVPRTQLIEAGLAIAVSSGIGAVTVRAVADRAHVALTMVYHCFETKDALVTAMAEQLVVQLHDGIRAAFVAATSVDEAPRLRGARGMRELLHRGLTGMWSVIESSGDRQLLSHEITAYSLRSRADGSAAASDIGVRQFEVMDSEAAEFLTRTAEFTSMNWTEPIDCLTRTALATIDGLVLRWLVDRDSLAIIADLDDLAARLTTKAVPQ